MKKYILIFLLAIMCSSSLFSQTVTLPEYPPNLPAIGSTFEVPLSMNGFPTQVFGVLIYFQFDPTVLDYTGIALNNYPTLLSVTEMSSSIIRVQLYGPGFAPFNSPSGEIVRLNFTFLGGDSELTFLSSGSYITSYLSYPNFTSVPVTGAGLDHGFVHGGEVSNTIDGGLWSTNLDWSLGVVPNAFHNVTVAPGSTVLLSATGLCNDLTIQSGGQLTVDGTLTNSGDVFIESNATGTGSLLHNSALNATIERYIPGGGYHFVSIPTTQASNPVSGLFTGSYLYRFDAPTQDWLGYGSATDTPLTVDQGYMIWYVGGNTTYEFTGALNNGSFTAATPSTVAGDFNLVPNPYPSAIDWEAASGWSDASFNPSIWVYSNGNYLAYNKVMDTGSASRYIAAGQSFFVQANAASVSLSMTNDVRVHSSQAFLKNTKAKKSNLLNIKVQANDYEDNAMVYFNEAGSLSYNNQTDIYKLDGMSNAPQLYTVKNDDVHVTLNTLPFNINETTIVPLNFSLNTNHEVTFDFTGMDSFEVSYGIELEDLLTGQIVNLREQSTYTFAHNVNNDASRFVLRFYGVTGIDSNSALNCKVWNSNELIYISIPALTGENAQIELYDLLGRKLSEVNCTINNPIQLTAPRSGIVMVKVIAGNKVQTSKLLIP